MLPIALGFGADAAPEQGLAVVIGGDIFWSALLCTNLPPALYLCSEARGAARTHIIRAVRCTEGTIELAKPPPDLVVVLLSTSGP